MKKHLIGSHSWVKAIKLLSFTLLAVLIEWFGVGPASVRQVGAYQNEGGDCKAIDVVILLDQSDSMREANDPNGRRFEAAQTIVTYLGNHAVWLCLDQDIQHRVAVIGFGDNYDNDVQIYLDDQIVPPENNLTSWKEDRQEINNQISSGREESLGATDHYTALLAANEILNEWRNVPLPGAPRRQAIVMITDGEPCLLERGCGVEGYYNISPDLADLKELTSSNNGQFPWRGADNPESVFLSLIAMSKRNGNFQEQFLTDWAEITQGHGSDVFRANEANTNLNTIVTDIMNPITGSGFEVIPCNQDVWVLPYEDDRLLIYIFSLTNATTSPRAVLNIDTGEETIQVQRGTASSNQVQITNYDSDERNEYYTLAAPPPGTYRITLPGVEDECADQMNIRGKTIKITHEVITPNLQSAFPAVDPPNLDVAEKFRVEVFSAVAEDEELQKRPLEEIDDYPLNIVATVTNPDGTQQVPIRLVKVQNGVYESPDVIQTPLPGTYEWNLVATVRHPNPEEADIEVFNEKGEFTATPVRTMGFQINAPVTGSVSPLNTVQGAQQVPLPVPVSVSFALDEGESVPVLYILADPATLFTASLISGATVHETIPLLPDPDSDNEFVGEFTNSDAGRILPAGDYTIQVDAHWDADNYDALKFVPGTAVESVNFQQMEVVPLDVVIQPPAPNTLHQDNWRANMLQGGNFQPFDFQIEVINAVNGETVLLNEVLADPDNPVQAAVIPPSGNPIPVTLRLLSNENFQQFLGENLGTDMSEEGEYQIKLQTASIDLQDGYAWGTSEQSASFSRQDHTWTRPGTWRLIGLILLILFLLLLFTTLYYWTGGPSGSLEIVKTSTRGLPETEAGPWRLGRMPRHKRVRNNWLKSHGIKHITVKKTRSLDPEQKRAVQVTAEDENGLEYFNQVMYPDEPATFMGEDGDIVYK